MYMIMTWRPVPTIIVRQMIPVTAKIIFMIAVVGVRGGPGGSAETGMGFDQLSLLLWEIRIIYVVAVEKEALGTKQS